MSICELEIVFYRWSTSIPELDHELVVEMNSNKFHASKCSAFTENISFLITYYIYPWYNNIIGVIRYQVTHRLNLNLWRFSRGK